MIKELKNQLAEKEDKIKELELQLYDEKHRMSELQFGLERISIGSNAVQDELTVVKEELKKKDDKVIGG